MRCFFWGSRIQLSGNVSALDSNILFLPYSFLPYLCAKRSRICSTLRENIGQSRECSCLDCVWSTRGTSGQLWIQKELQRQSILLVTSVAAAASVPSSLTSTKKTLSLSAPASSAVTFISSIFFLKAMFCVNTATQSTSWDFCKSCYMV